ncbi:MAG: substrate-binding domain-containing protein [Myxococcales bacterium]|nr:substrate-binding domain-containing protein [Myxococcales bacterium]
MFTPSLSLLVPSSSARAHSRLLIASLTASFLFASCSKPKIESEPGGPPRPESSPSAQSPAAQSPSAQSPSAQSPSAQSAAPSSAPPEGTEPSAEPGGAPPGEEPALQGEPPAEGTEEDPGQGGEPSVEAPEATAPAAPLKLRVYVPPSLGKTFRELALKYATVSPDVTVDVVADDLYETLRRMGDEGGDVLVAEGWGAYEAARAASVVRSDGVTVVGFLPIGVSVSGAVRGEVSAVTQLSGRRIGLPDGRVSTAPDAARRLLARAKLEKVQEVVIPGNPSSALRDGTIDAYVSWGTLADAGVPLDVPVALEELLPIPAGLTAFTKNDAAANAFLTWLTTDVARETFGCQSAIALPAEGRRKCPTVIPIRLPEPRRQAGVVSLNGRVGLFGGDAGGRRLASIVWVDLTAFGVSTALATLDAPAAGVTAEWVPSSKAVYLFGGETAEGLSDAVQRYEPATDTLQVLPLRMPVKRHAMTGAVAHDKVFLFGGIDESGAASAEIHVFDPASGTTATLTATLPAPRARMARAPGNDGTLLLLGGDEGNTALPSADVVEFDASARAVRRSTLRLDVPRSAAAVVPWKGGWLVAGGFTTGGLSDQVLVMSAQGEHRFLDVSLPEGLAEAAVAELGATDSGGAESGGAVLLLGGITRDRVDARLIRLPE